MFFRTIIESRNFIIGRYINAIVVVALYDKDTDFSFLYILYK